MTDPRNEAPRIPGEFGVDVDPYTDEDGFTDGAPDNTDGPLPEIAEDVPEDD